MDFVLRSFVCSLISFTVSIVVKLFVPILTSDIFSALGDGFEMRYEDNVTLVC